MIRNINIWLGAFLLVVGSLTLSIMPLGALPDFAQINDITEKKQNFFDFIKPKAKKINTTIEQNRKKLLSLYQQWQKKKQLNKNDLNWLKKISKHYKIGAKQLNEDYWQFLLRRVDTIPLSLILSQAANESGWGTSRFARQGYNLFGQWCLEPGCGLIPEKREENLYHEVKVFPTPCASIQSYIHNLNTHRAYQNLRLSRQQLRSKNQQIKGSDLVHALKPYSARGEDYVKEIYSIIRMNKLEKYDL